MEKEICGVDVLFKSSIIHTASGEMCIGFKMLLNGTMTIVRHRNCFSLIKRVNGTCPMVDSGMPDS